MCYFAASAIVAIIIFVTLCTLLGFFFCSVCSVLFLFIVFYIIVCYLSRWIKLFKMFAFISNFKLKYAEIQQEPTHESHFCAQINTFWAGRILAFHGPHALLYSFKRHISERPINCWRSSWRTFFSVARLPSLIPLLCQTDSSSIYRIIQAYVRRSKEADRDRYRHTVTRWSLRENDELIPLPLRRPCALVRAHSAHPTCYSGTDQ